VVRDHISSNEFTYDHPFGIYHAMAGRLGSKFDESSKVLHVVLEHSKKVIEFYQAEVLTDDWGVVGWMYLQDKSNTEHGICYAVMVWNR